jgi:hypothetical protein
MHGALPDLGLDEADLGPPLHLGPRFRSCCCSGAAHSPSRVIRKRRPVVPGSAASSSRSVEEEDQKEKSSPVEEEQTKRMQPAGAQKNTDPRNHGEAEHEEDEDGPGVWRLSQSRAA